MTQAIQSSCRVCGGDILTPAFTLGIENAWVYCGDAEGHHGCGLLQRAHVGTRMPSGPLPVLSWTEQYRLRDVVAGALEMMTTREGTALDIGCGGGDLLAAYPRWVTPVGIDQRLGTTGATDWGIGINTPFEAPDTQAALREIADKGYDVITAVGHLEHESDPRAFFARIKTLLARDGLFIVETPYIALALTRTLTSPFHQYARAIYSLASLERLAAEAGLRIVRGSMSENAGGSLRLTMVHKDYHGHDYGPWFEMLARMWDEESALSLTGRQASNAFLTRVSARRLEVASLKAQILRADEHAYVVGTCAQTFSMLNAADMGYDVISAHIGHEPRTGFPEVITEQEAAMAPADLLIAPSWRRRETLEHWYDQIMAGMRLVFLEPELIVVDRQNYAAELGRALAVTDGPGSVDTLRAALAAMRGPGLRLVAQSAQTGS